MWILVSWHAIQFNPTVRATVTVRYWLFVSHNWSCAVIINFRLTQTCWTPKKSVSNTVASALKPSGETSQDEGINQDVKMGESRSTRGYEAVYINLFKRKGCAAHSNLIVQITLIFLGFGTMRVYYSALRWWSCNSQRLFCRIRQVVAYIKPFCNFLICLACYPQHACCVTVPN